MARSSLSQSFVIFEGGRNSEVPRSFAEPVPQALGFLDQFGLWDNWGVSLLGFIRAMFARQSNGAGTPELSLAAAITSI